MVTVSRQQVEVNVRPTSGVPLSRNAVLAAVTDELREMELTRRRRPGSTWPRTG